MELDFLSKRMEVGHVCGVQPVFDYSFLIHSLIPELSILLTPPRCEKRDQIFFYTYFARLCRRDGRVLMDQWMDWVIKIIDGVGEGSSTRLIMNLGDDCRWWC